MSSLSLPDGLEIEVSEMASPNPEICWLLVWQLLLLWISSILCATSLWKCLIPVLHVAHRNSIYKYTANLLSRQLRGGNSSATSPQPISSRMRSHLCFYLRECSRPELVALPYNLHNLAISYNYSGGSWWDELLLLHNLLLFPFTDSGWDFPLNDDSCSFAFEFTTTCRNSGSVNNFFLFVASNLYCLLRIRLFPIASISANYRVMSHGSPVHHILVMPHQQDPPVWERSSNILSSS